MSPDGEQLAEVGVSADEDATGIARGCHDLLVERATETKLRDVTGIVARVGKKSREALGQRLVDEELQADAAGSSRSSTAAAA